jgi:uncharacterized protein (DUF924 family)
MTVEPPLYAEIVDFWREAGPKRWFRGGAAFDEAIRARFETAHLAASRGEFADWADEADGALALLILTDQFPRNLYRGSAHAFATDAIARTVAARALEARFDETVEPLLRPFFYLPFEHSEDAGDQARSVALFEALARDAGDHDSLKWARLHQDIIARFGRFPHRNPMFGRASTPEETAFLANGGFAG